jgi:hypothetical protein
MVYLHMSSKEIARELKISPHTVDQRIRLALQHLGVTTRIEAAKLLAAHENIAGYQPATYQAPYLATELVSSDGDCALECGEQSLHFPQNKVMQAEPSMFPVDLALPVMRNKWPFPLREGERNELSIAERLGWILAIAIGSALAFGMILAGMDALSHLV